MKFICHLRHNEVLTNIIEGKVLDKRGRGRTKKSYLEDIKHRMQIDKMFEDGHFIGKDKNDSSRSVDFKEKMKANLDDDKYMFNIFYIH